MSERKILGTLSEGQIDMYLKMQMCERACEKLIKSVVHEYEEAELHTFYFWLGVKDQFEIPSTQTIKIDTITREVYCQTPLEALEAREEKATSRSMKKWILDSFKSLRDET